MLSEEALERLSERLVDRIEQLNEYFINLLGEQIIDIGNMNPTQLAQLFQSIKYGNNLDKIAYKLAEITDRNIEDIYKIFEEVAKKSQAYAKQFYEYRNIKFTPFDENIALQKQVKAIAKITVNEYINIARTTAYMRFNNLGIKEFTSLSETYQKITDEAILSISQGREMFNTTMRRAMKDLTSHGLRTVDYATGNSRRLDSAVRMNIMDGVRRLNRELQEQFGQEFDANGIEVSHHINPAPDHEDTVDGKQFSINGKVMVNGIRYANYDVINNSLTRHVGELNCYHFTYSIILGVSKPRYSKEELEKDKNSNQEGFEFDGKHYTNYEGTQLQRKIETKIRQFKDRQIGAKAINDMDEVYHCQEKIRQLSQKYKELSDVSGLPTKVERLKVEGYKRVKIKNDVYPYEDVRQEWFDNATPNSHSVQDKNYFEHEGVRYEVDGKNVVLDYSQYEKEIEEWLENTFGGEIYMLPRINNPIGIETADYLFRSEYWDLKEIFGNGKHTLDSAIKKKKDQANNFIFDISNSKMTNKEAIRQLNLIFKSKDRRWLENVILKRNKEVIVILKRKKRD